MTDPYRAKLPDPGATRYRIVKTKWNNDSYRVIIELQKLVISNKRRSFGQWLRCELPQAKQDWIVLDCSPIYAIERHEEIDEYIEKFQQRIADLEEFDRNATSSGVIVAEFSVNK